MAGSRASLRTGPFQGQILHPARGSNAILVKGIIFPELCMAQPMELTLCPWGAQGGGEALVGRGLHCSSNGGKPGLGELLPSAPHQGLSPPGVLGFGVFIGFERVARFNLLGVLQADPLLQPDPSSSPSSPDLHPCSSNNPPTAAQPALQRGENANFQRFLPKAIPHRGPGAPRGTHRGRWML